MTCQLTSWLPSFLHLARSFLPYVDLVKCLVPARDTVTNTGKLCCEQQANQIALVDCVRSENPRCYQRMIGWTTLSVFLKLKRGQAVEWKKVAPAKPDHTSQTSLDTPAYFPAMFCPWCLFLCGSLQVIPPSPCQKSINGKDLSPILLAMCTVELFTVELFNFL